MMTLLLIWLLILNMNCIFFMYVYDDIQIQTFECRIVASMYHSIVGFFLVNFAKDAHLFCLLF